jgi:hypothetical protein
MDWFRLHQPKRTKQNSFVPEETIAQPTFVNITHILLWDHMTAPAVMDVQFRVQILMQSCEGM